MKVLIEISEELYKNVVEHTKNGYIGSDVWIAVANGIPYEEINNASTVDTSSHCACCKYYDPIVTYEGMQWRNRGDGYCKLSRNSTEGNVLIMVNDEDFCNLFEKKGEANENLNQDTV